MVFLLLLFIILSLLTLIFIRLFKRYAIKRDDEINYAGRAKTPLTTRYTLHPIKPFWVKPEVVRLKALMPAYGCRKIAAAFNRLHHARLVVVSKSYVANVIRDHQYDDSGTGQKDETSATSTGG